MGDGMGDSMGHSGSTTATPLNRRPSIADEAAEWLATLTDSACTEEERHAFVGWLRRSNLHVEEFLRVSTLARRLSGPGGLPPADIEDLVRCAKADLAGGSRVTDLVSRTTDIWTPDARTASQQRSSASASRRRSPLLWVAAACASLVAVVALVVSRYGLLDQSTSTYSTSLGELRSITLEDGSIVELNTRSTLRTHFTPAERRVELLSGEAVFKVAKNPARPFRVLAGAAQIVAVGTAFNVYAQSARTVVTVLEGRVRVLEQDAREPASPRPAPSEQGQEMELGRGEQAIVAPHAPIAKAVLADARRVTSWTERRLVFEETPLAAAAAEFARYSPQLIRIEDAKLAELHITGVFDATDPASLVQFVQTYAGVEVRASGSGWTLGGERQSSPGSARPGEISTLQ